MRYKTLVSNKLETIQNMVNIITNGLENRKMTAEEILAKAKQITSILEDVINLIDKETEGLN
mgnify:FL=1